VHHCEEAKGAARGEAATERGGRREARATKRHSLASVPCWKEFVECLFPLALRSFEPGVEKSISLSLSFKLMLSRAKEIKRERERERKKEKERDATRGR
jgi:hypothetical protein